MKETKIKLNNKIEIFVYNFLEEGILLKNKKKFIESVTSKLKYNEIGFAGWKDKRGFIEHLKCWLFSDVDKNKNYPDKFLSSERVNELIKKTLIKCSAVLNREKLYIYIFPTLSKFVIEKMGRVGGISIWKKVIYIDIFPVKDVEKHIQFSIAHELAHAISPFYHENLSIGNGIVFDGIAEHFRNNFLGGKKSLWSNALSKEKAKKIFNEIKPRLEEKNYNFYKEVFYGTGKYPLWSGYAMGYHILGDYLKKLKKTDWKKIINTNPGKILKESGWL